MKPGHAVLVQQTFERASRIAPHLAATFYRELFAIDPSLRAMFKGDMIAQGDKLMAMLAHVIEGLTTPSALLADIRALAIRHVEYGVEERHYVMVGTALMRTLKHELNGDFTPETREAWAAAYHFLAGAMCEAAYSPVPAAASR